MTRLSSLFSQDGAQGEDAMDIDNDEEQEANDRAAPTSPGTFDARFAEFEQRMEGFLRSVEEGELEEFGWSSGELILVLCGEGKQLNSHMHCQILFRWTRREESTLVEKVIPHTSLTPLVDGFMPTTTKKAIIPINSHPDRKPAS